MPDELRKPIELLPIFQERVWGRDTLAPFFGGAPLADRIGEVWFTFAENETSLDQSLGELLTAHPEILGEAADPQHAGLCPILVKLLFTTSKLSVQVHPDDTYAKEHHGSPGKTEAWYVLESQPPGELAVGFRQEISRQQLRESAQSGKIERLLNWQRVSAGDVIFAPAGTVHAIGAGLTICEIQQNSDITYRLYDYGRPRELHLDHAVNVAHLAPRDYKMSPEPLADWRDHLVASEYFRVERLHPTGTVQVSGGLPYYLILICVKGWGKIADQPTTAGEAWLIPAAGEPFLLETPGSEWILTYTAKEPLDGITAV